MLVSIQNLIIRADKNICEIHWSDGHTSRFHSKWLRFHCNCERCLPQVSAAYPIDISEFPDKLFINEANYNKTDLTLQFLDEPFADHVTILSINWLRSKCYCDECLNLKLDKSDVIKRNIEKIRKENKRETPTMSFKKIEEDENRGIFECLSQIIHSGFSLLQDVPTEVNTVAKIAEMFGSYVYQTTHRKMFDIIVKNMGSHVANTTGMLPLHQDQCYYESCPGVLLLHCIKFDPCIIGGESSVVDVFEAVEVLRNESPENFQTLTEIPTTYTLEANDDDHLVYLKHQKASITLDCFGKVVGVNWSPSLVGTTQIPEKDVDRYYTAYAHLLKIVKRPNLQYRFKLKPGDALVMNNRRMLHARDAYKTNGGQRHLQGCYVKLDELKSRYLTLAKKLGVDVVVPKVGNNTSV